MADGYRRRALTVASTLVPATCGSAGGMPCVPAARGGGRKLLGVATSDGRQLRCGWPQKAVESAFQMVDRRGKVSGLIRQPLTKRKTSCGGVRVSLRACGGGGACSRSGYAAAAPLYTRELPGESMWTIAEELGSGAVRVARVQKQSSTAHGMQLRPYMQDN
uniref:Uncharacterized protein n=1 Tax=Oryza rufipogon TaxID=4529 RepID=A0A0E0QQG4_ORYRU